MSHHNRLRGIRPGPLEFMVVDPHALRAAAFLIQALDLDETPEALAKDVVALKRDANAGISTVELESSIGPAAFLVYDYRLDVMNEAGESGRDLFDAGLQVLERAAELDSPGPRIVAHAIAGNDAFILATTPAVQRALAGEPGAIEAGEAQLLPGDATAEVRAKSAAELMRLLREADAQARRWLNALQAEGNLEAQGAGDALIEFGDAETALALFVLDDRSIRHLLQALNLLLSSAKQQTQARLHAEGAEQDGIESPG